MTKLSNLFSKKDVAHIRKMRMAAIENAMEHSGLPYAVVAIEVDEQLKNQMLQHVFNSLMPVILPQIDELILDLEHHYHD